MTRNHHPYAVAVAIAALTVLAGALGPVAQATSEPGAALGDAGPGDELPVQPPEIGIVDLPVNGTNDPDPPCDPEPRLFEEEADRDPDLCPPTTDGGASCISHGILVVERDNSGFVGDVTFTASTSRAATDADAILKPFPALDLVPASNPDADASATQVGAAYTNGPLSITSDTVHSRCDVLAYDEVSNAYGRAGVEDLDIDLGGNLLSAGVLNYAEEARGIFLAEAQHTCEILRLGVLGNPGTICPGPNTGLALGGQSVTLNEAWGPVSFDNEHIYGGAATHLSFSTASLQTVDVYIGYTAVSVHADQADPPVFVP